MLWFHKEGLLLIDPDGDRAIVEYDVDDLECHWKARYIEGIAKGATEDLLEDDGWFAHA